MQIGPEVKDLWRGQNMSYPVLKQMAANTSCLAMQLVMSLAALQKHKPS